MNQREAQRGVARVFEKLFADLLGVIVVIKVKGGGTRDVQDGPELHISLSLEMGVGQRLIILVLQYRRMWASPGAAAVEVVCQANTA